MSRRRPRSNKDESSSDLSEEVEVALQSPVRKKAKTPTQNSILNGTYTRAM